MDCECCVLFSRAHSSVRAVTNEASDNAQNAAGQAPSVDKTVRKEAWKNVALYGLARLLLFIVLTAVIQGLAVAIGAPVPVLISATLALIIAFPLSMLVFKGVRIRATESVALWDAQRKAQKEWLRKELSER